LEGQGKILRSILGLFLSLSLLLSPNGVFAQKDLPEAYRQMVLNPDRVIDELDQERLLSDPGAKYFGREHLSAAISMLGKDYPFENIEKRLTERFHRKGVESRLGNRNLKGSIFYFRNFYNHSLFLLSLIKVPGHFYLESQYKSWLKSLDELDFLEGSEQEKYDWSKLILETFSLALEQSGHWDEETLRRFETSLANRSEIQPDAINKNFKRGLDQYTIDPRFSHTQRALQTITFLSVFLANVGLHTGLYATTFGTLLSEQLCTGTFSQMAFCLSSIAGTLGSFFWSSVRLIPFMEESFKIAWVKRTHSYTFGGIGKTCESFLVRESQKGRRTSND